MHTANAGTLSLRAFDWVVVNSSAGKDSQAMLDVVYEQARQEGVLDRVVVVHADLARVEWAGTRELAERQARHYRVRFEVVKRRQNDLLDHVLARGKWPSSAARFCTSEHKRGPVTTLLTRLTAETRRRQPRKVVKLLNCLGLRAVESHPAYALGMPRFPLRFPPALDGGAPHLLLAEFDIQPLELASCLSYLEPSLRALKAQPSRFRLQLLDDYLQVLIHSRLPEADVEMRMTSVAEALIA